MNIDGIYIGGWFQRTMLQLTEIYDFLRLRPSNLALNKKKLQEYNKDLNIVNIEYKVAGIEYIEFTTYLNIDVKIFEDGLIILRNREANVDNLDKELNDLKSYYENNLSKAFNYLFSLGAPVPKELANIETVYPYFIVLDKASEEDINKLLSVNEEIKYFEFKSNKYDVKRGDIYYFINNKKQSIDDIERYIEEQIFIREFKGQLHRYLNLHRVIWEKIDKVKEHAKVKGSDIIKFTTKLEGYAKTITLIDGRIKQMGTYISTRERIAKSDSELVEFLNVSGYRYETLRDTLDYIKYLWDMTKNYVAAAQKLFDGLKSDVTSASISNLTIVTSMGVGASLLGLFTESAPTFSIFGFIYFFVLAVIGLVVNKIMSTIANKRTYEVNDITYDKNID